MREAKLLSILATLTIGSLISPISRAGEPDGGKPVGHVSYHYGSSPMQPGHISECAASIHNANMSSVFNPAPVQNYGHIRAQADQAKSLATQLSSQALSLQSQVRQAQQQASTYTPSTGFGTSIDDLIGSLTDDLMSQAPSKDIDLRSIPDPLDSALGYDFKSDNPEVKTIYKNLYKINPYYENRIKAKGFGLLSAMEADRAYAEGNHFDGNFYRDMAQGFLDIAVGFDPITGIARSTYELFVGRNLITGAVLSGGERALAFVGVMTAGGGRTLLQAGRVINRVFNGASHLLANRQAAQAAIREGQALAGRVQHLAEGIIKPHRITAIKTAEEANVSFVAKGWERPYQDGSHVVEFVTTKDTHWVRVHGADNQTRSWVMKRSSIEGLSPEQIRTKFAIPDLPTHISDVRVPAGTLMVRGNVQYHQMDRLTMPSNAPSGAIQYNIGQRIDSSNFTNMRPLLY